MDSGTALHLVAMAFGAGSVYTAIRADLRSIHVRLAALEQRFTKGVPHGTQA